MQSINLYDVLSSGAFIVPDAPAMCGTNPGAISADIVTDVRNALTIGRIAACGSSVVGLVHASASGYATIDLVKSCGINFPTGAAYYDELLYDNVLTGDYQTLDSNPARGNYASGSPLVHIRAGRIALRRYRRWPIEPSLSGQPDLASAVEHGHGLWRAAIRRRLVGAEDGVDPVRRSEGHLALFPQGTERRVVAGTGHFMPREQPGAVVDALVALLRRRAAPS